MHITTPHGGPAFSLPAQIPSFKQKDCNCSVREDRRGEGAGVKEQVMQIADRWMR